MATDLFTRLESISPSMGREAMCDEIIEVGQALEQGLPSYGRLTLNSLSQQIRRLRTELVDAFPVKADPAPFLALVSALPLDVKNAHRLTYEFNDLNQDESQGPVLFQITSSIVANLKRNRTFEREAEFFKAAHPPRTAGQGAWNLSEFETDFISMAFNLMESQGQGEHCCLDLIEHVFSFSINCHYANLKAPLLEAMLAMGINRGRDGQAAGWPAVKQWLDANEDLVCTGLLNESWSAELKPELVKKANNLGYQKLANTILLRSCRHEEDTFLLLKRDFNIDPDQKCYDAILKDHNGLACAAESKSLTALLAHALVYDHQLPDDWMVDRNASPARLLDKAYREALKNGFLPSEDKLKDMFEQSIRKLRNDRDLKWLESSYFSGFLKDSLAYQAERFGQDLGL
ncbi:hypothetical protein V0M98_36115 (plasmid) [Pseudomonas silesiensis]|uniref:hypothetical protein n=1 Tax=Pseudomonas silesiensis TaxID=1853130 RepID=UPI0030D2628E